jgi:hypothetical protein
VDGRTAGYLKRVCDYVHLNPARAKWVPAEQPLKTFFWSIQVLAEALQRRRWTPADLKARRKGDPAKVALAARLRAQTTMTVGWIAERLWMGTRGHLNHLLYRRRKSRTEYPLSRTDPNGP